MKNNGIYIILIIIILIFIYLISLPLQKKENFIIDSLKEKLTIVDPGFKHLDIREGSSSYTEDKSTIFLCLRDEKGKDYPINTIIYVALHEIAHMLNKDNYGHTEEFHSVFNDLLCKAAKKGIYDPNKPHGNWYCGVDISGITMPKCNI